MDEDERPCQPRDPGDAPVDRAVRAILNEEPLSCRTSLWYQTFAREVLYTRMQFETPPAAIPELSQAINRWTARGLKQALLDRIKDCVIALTLPDAEAPAA
jgi:hypothetical protein